MVTVEILSPPLYFTPESIAQVVAVCEVLSNNYRIVSKGALHIHVGNETKGFSGAAIHKLLATLWTFEPAIETIYPSYRVQNRFCPGLMKSSNLLKELEKPDMTEEKVLQELLESESLDDAVRLLAEGGSSKAKLISINVYLASIADFAEMNKVYDAWLDTANLPARATVETRLASPNFRVEMTAIAAAD